MTDYRSITPTSDEIAIAQQSYLNWERSQAEELAEYVSRRRTVELADLIGEIIDTELSEAERSLIKKYWHEKKSIPSIAKETRLSKSTVSRVLDRSYKKIEVLLRYAVKYQYNIKKTDFLPVAVREAFMLESQRHFEPASVGKRLENLRKRENLSAETFSQATDIPLEHIQALEDESSLPNTEDLIKFSSFFGVTIDYILKGVDADGKKITQ